MPVFGNQTYHSTLHVQDTTAPAVTLATDSIEMYTTATPPTAADLVDSVIDVTNCSIDFKEPYDFTKEGKFDIVVLVADSSGNTTESVIPCTVVDDVTPPEIAGVEPLNRSWYLWKMRRYQQDALENHPHCICLCLLLYKPQNKLNLTEKNRR